MADEIVSQAEAKAKGLKFCFTGKPCSQGHISPRYVAGYWCVECTKSESRKKSVADYHKSIADERKAYMRSWRDKNREKVNQYGCEWAKAHPEEHARRARLRRARVRGAEGDHTVEEISALAVRQKFKCVNCKCSIKEMYEVDHITALSRGGSNSIRNIQLLCVSCNRRKNAKDPIEWAQENGRLI